MAGNSPLQDMAYQGGEILARKMGIGGSAGPATSGFWAKAMPTRTGCPTRVSSRPVLTPPRRTAMEMGSMMAQRLKTGVTRWLQTQMVMGSVMETR